MSSSMEMKTSLHGHLKLLDRSPIQQEGEKATMTPLFTANIFEHVNQKRLQGMQQPFKQYGLLGGATDMLKEDPSFHDMSSPTAGEDPRLFVSISTPLSTCICGSQGSGKSHTLSCLLENCLITSSTVNKLSSPLTGLVFHYDTFISDHGVSPCEVAFLSSNSNIKVRVLCCPTNTGTIQRTYAALNVEVEPLYIKEEGLNTKRMLDLMAVKQEDGPTPLYIHTVIRVLREMRIVQQNTGSSFKYHEFKKLLLCASLTPAQLTPLHQRLETLESFMIPASSLKSGKKARKSHREENGWYPKAGQPTIVDLSCPCINPETAYSMFNICLSIFLEQDMIMGRVVALDEAHKYMNTSPEATAFAGTLLSTIRLQSHLGTRIFISTQEPTISPTLLDLSPIVIVHRFSSPEWLQVLRQRLAPVSSESAQQDSHLIHNQRQREGEKFMGKAGTTKEIFRDIVKLKVGEALIFSPSAMIGFDIDSNGSRTIRRLGFDYVKVRIRARSTKDGGKSVLAV